MRLLFCHGFPCPSINRFPKTPRARVCGLEECASCSACSIFERPEAEASAVSFPGCRIAPCNHFLGFLSMLCSGKPAGDPVAFFHSSTPVDPSAFFAAPVNSQRNCDLETAGNQRHPPSLGIRKYSIVARKVFIARVSQRFFLGIVDILSH